MKKFNLIIALILVLGLGSCGEGWLDLEPRGTELETGFYQNESQVFQGLVSIYDVLQWGGTNSTWTMKIGLLNAASDDTYAGGSDASDQPAWVAYDNFTLDPFLGPQQGLWTKYYSGIYRANLLLEKMDATEGLDEAFLNRMTAETKFLRAYFYFDLLRFFRNVPLITKTLGGDELYTQSQADPEDVYALVIQDLEDAIGTFELPDQVGVTEAGRVTKGAAKALLGKVLLFKGDQLARAATLFQEVINSGFYDLEPDFGDIFTKTNEFGIESVFEVSYSAEARAGWDRFNNGSEGNYNVQFFGIRDYVGPLFAPGWGFCPVTEDLHEFMQGDPRYAHTIINLDSFPNATFTAGFQHTGYFIRKYAPIEAEKAPDGEPALNWSNNIREIRFADVLLMAAESILRSGGDQSLASQYLNRVRARVGLGPVIGSGQGLLKAVYKERRLELATEGHRFFDLVRTGEAANELAAEGFVTGKHELLPIPQTEIDITNGTLVQNPNY